MSWIPGQCSVANISLIDILQVAIAESVLALAHLIRKFKFEMEGDIELECGIHLMPKSMRMSVELR